MSEIERPDLSHTPTSDLAAMMIVCGMSNDPSDKQFAKFCREEISRRKPDQPNAAKEQEAK